VVGEDTLRETQKLSQEVPEHVADSITIAGNVDDCIDKIEEFIRSGVTHFAFNIEAGVTHFASTVPAEETLEALRSKVIPYFKKSQETRNTNA
jgi:hypothetical protein